LRRTKRPGCGVVSLKTTAGATANAGSLSDVVDAKQVK
jgi:hypothetical protein